MGSEGRREGLALSEHLFHAAYKYEFFQAVRVLHRWGQLEQAAETGRPDTRTTQARPTTGGGSGLARVPVGGDGDPDREAVRFRAIGSLTFPAGAIRDLKPPAAQGGFPSEGPPEMHVAFLGLTGPAGVLPPHYTSKVIERARLRDFALRDFFDIFHHRTVSLFYRAWEKYRFPLVFEQAQWRAAAHSTATVAEAEDLFTQTLYCLVGLGTEGLRHQLPVDDQTLLYYAGHFSHQPRSALALEMLLSDYFSQAVVIEQFQGQWLRLDPTDQTRLGEGTPGESLNNGLGQTALLGERVWDVQSKFRVRLGPLSYQAFCGFFPGSQGLARLGALAHLYAGSDFDLDVQPVLAADQVPPLQLARGEPGPRLGWNTWVLSGPLSQDAADAVFVA